MKELNSRLESKLRRHFSMPLFIESTKFPEEIEQKRKNPRACSRYWEFEERADEADAWPGKFSDTKDAKVIQISSSGAIFFPKANSSGSGATVLSEPVFSSGQRYGRHWMPVVYSEPEFHEENWPPRTKEERGSRCEIARGCFATFRSLASHYGASAMSKRQTPNKRSIKVAY